MLIRAVGRSLDAAGRRAICSKPSFIPTCPAATQCCATLPPGLDIDRESPLWGRIPFYSNHLVVSTGNTDWTSKVEDDPVGWFAADLKKAYLNHRQTRQIEGNPTSKASLQPLVSCSSFAPVLNPRDSKDNTIGLFSFPRSEYAEIRIRPDAGESTHAIINEIVARDDRSQDADFQGSSGHQFAMHHHNGQDIICRPADGITVLICGHGGRDQRCGIIGPLLQKEFILQLQTSGLSIEEGSPGIAGADPNVEQAAVARVGLISHIGGHKWAGNVIIYISPRLSEHRLRGMGIWYSRVEPRHVEGIVLETVSKGRIIEELCRGGILQSGQPLERP